jgi:hypothetical protein
MYCRFGRNRNTWEPTSKLALTLFVWILPDIGVNNTHSLTHGVLHVHRQHAVHSSRKLTASRSVMRARRSLLPTRGNHTLPDVTHAAPEKSSTFTGKLRPVAASEDTLGSVRRKCWLLYTRQSGTAARTRPMKSKISVRYDVKANGKAASVLH